MVGDYDWLNRFARGKLYEEGDRRNWLSTETAIPLKNYNWLLDDSNSVACVPPVIRETAMGATKLHATRMKFSSSASNQQVISGVTKNFPRVDSG